MTQTDGSSEDQAPPWERLRSLIAAHDRAAAQALVDEVPSGDLPRVLSLLGNEESARLLEMLEPATSGALMETIPEAQATEMLGELDSETAAEIVAQLPSNEQADLISNLPDDEAQAILAQMPPAEAADAERLAQYPEGTAGSLMIRAMEAVPVQAPLATYRSLGAARRHRRR